MSLPVTTTLSVEDDNANIENFEVVDNNNLAVPDVDDSDDVAYIEDIEEDIDDEIEDFENIEDLESNEVEEVEDFEDIENIDDDRWTLEEYDRQAIQECIVISGLDIRSILRLIAWEDQNGELSPCNNCLVYGWVDRGPDDRGPDAASYPGSYPGNGLGRCCNHFDHDNEPFLHRIELLIPRFEAMFQYQE